MSVVGHSLSETSGGDLRIPSALDVKQIFLTNIKLLGFNTAAHEATLRIPFNKDMFTRPSKAASEAVLHFLFERLNPTMCHEEFRDCWPIKNKKEEAQFRKVCHNWLTNIQKEEPDSNLPRVPASVLLSPGGDKFYELVCDFSTYVLLQVIKKECGLHGKDMIHFPPLNRQNIHLGDITARAFQCGAVRHRQRFLDRIYTSLKANDQRNTHINELVKDHRKLTKIIRDLEREVRELQQISAEKVTSSPYARKNRNSSAFELDSQSIKRAQKLHKVQDMWKQLSDYSKATREKEIIESILDRTLQTHQIDSNNFSVKVPDLLLRECEQEIHRRHVDNIYEGGKLNLVSVVQLWNLSLHLYIERLHQAGVPNFENEVEKVRSQLHTLQASLANTETFRSQITSEIGPCLCRIDELREQLENQGTEKKTPKSKRLGFGLTTPSPAMSFTPVEQSADVDLGITAFPQQPEKDTTPEAAASILETVAQSARKGSRRLFQGSPVYAPKLAMQGLPSAENRNQVDQFMNERRMASLKNKVKLTNPIKKTKVPQSVQTHQVRDVPQSVKSQQMRDVPLKTDRNIPKRRTGSVSDLSSNNNSVAGLDTLEVEREDSTPCKTFSYKQSGSWQHKPVRRHSVDDTTQLALGENSRVSVNDKTPTATPSKLPSPPSTPNRTSVNHKDTSQQGRLTPSQRVISNAHDILAEKIVSAVMQQEADLKAEVYRLEESLRRSGLSPPEISTLMDINLENPCAAISQDAFVSKDRIARSPLEPQLRKLFREAVEDHDKHNRTARKQLTMTEDTQPERTAAVSPELRGELNEDGVDTEANNSAAVVELSESSETQRTKVLQTDLGMENKTYPGYGVFTSGSKIRKADGANSSFQTLFSDLKLDYELEKEEFPAFDDDLEGELREWQSDSEDYLTPVFGASGGQTQLATVRQMNRSQDEDLQPTESHTAGLADITDPSIRRDDRSFQSPLSNHSPVSPVQSDDQSPQSPPENHSLDSAVRSESSQSALLSSLDELFAVKSSQFNDDKYRTTNSNPFSSDSGQFHKAKFPEAVSSAKLVSFSPFEPKSHNNEHSASHSAFMRTGQDISQLDEFEVSDGPSSLDDSFVPLKGGVLLDGKSPAKPSSQLSPFEKNHRMLQKMHVKNDKTVGVPHRTESESIMYESDVHMSSCSSDDHFIDMLSEKYHIGANDQHHLHSVKNGSHNISAKQNSDNPSTALSQSSVNKR